MVATNIGEIATELLQLLTTEQAWHYRVIPKEQRGKTLGMWIDETIEATSVQAELQMILNTSIHLSPIQSSAIQQALNTHYRKEKVRVASQEISIDKEDEDFLAILINEARSYGSSDIHVEPYKDRNRVRIRIDGVLVERYVIKKQEYPGLVNKIKIRAHLDIAEKRLPQDGRMHFENGSDHFDIRVSILPTLYGEKVVMRLLRNDATNVDIDALGFAKEDLERFLDGIKKPHGIILVSGPTGSGKTTTLYATLKLLNLQSRNIMTVEDPIEYTLEGINQVQVKENIGLDFAKALRSFLRQDPDVIMVGEIRDAETAAIAIRAALTGHLVLSTIHTNSAWGTVSRLIDMGMQPFLLASTLNTSMAQRLVRLLCPHCKKPVSAATAVFPSTFNKTFDGADTIFEPDGCEQCHYAGYKGRRAIFEVIAMDNDLSLAIKNNELEVSNLLKEKKVRSLKTRAYDMLAAGDTSLEEVYALLSN